MPISSHFFLKRCFQCPVLNWKVSLCRGEGSLETHYSCFLALKQYKHYTFKKKEWETTMMRLRACGYNTHKKRKQQQQLINGARGRGKRKKVSQTIIKMERVPEISCYSRVQHKHWKEKKMTKTNQKPPVSKERPTAAFNWVKGIKKKGGEHNCRSGERQSKKEKGEWVKRVGKAMGALIKPAKLELSISE